MLLGMMLALAGCGHGRPAPQVLDAAGTHKILLVGDELLGRTATRIAPSLAFHGLGAQVVDLTSPGTGLLDAGIMDSLRTRFDANADASMVVVEFMGHCSACPVEPGSPEHARQWIAAARQVIDEIRGRGMVPIWVVAPPVDPKLANAPVLKALADEGLSFARAQRCRGGELGRRVHRCRRAIPAPVALREGLRTSGVACRSRRRRRLHR